jgi:hypothetical protein
MAAPYSLGTEEVVQGSSWTPIFTLRDADGSPYDLSAPGAVASFRVLRYNTSGFPVVRTSAVPDQVELVNGGADGEAQPLFAAYDTQEWDPGIYFIEVIYESVASTPPTRLVLGRGILRVVAPRTGTLAPSAYPDGVSAPVEFGEVTAS